MSTNLTIIQVSGTVIGGINIGVPAMVTDTPPFSDLPKIAVLPGVQVPEAILMGLGATTTAGGVGGSILSVPGGKPPVPRLDWWSDVTGRHAFYAVIGAAVANAASVNRLITMSSSPSTNAVAEKKVDFKKVGGWIGYFLGQERAALIEQASSKSLHTLPTNVDSALLNAAMEVGSDPLFCRLEEEETAKEAGKRAAQVLSGIEIQELAA